MANGTLKSSFYFFAITPPPVLDVKPDQLLSTNYQPAASLTLLIRNWEDNDFIISIERKIPRTQILNKYVPEYEIPIREGQRKQTTVIRRPTRANYIFN